VGIPWLSPVVHRSPLAQEARQQLPDVALGLWPGASEAEPYDEMREAKGAGSKALTDIYRARFRLFMIILDVYNDIDIDINI
jgi:hypothetical protein